MTILDSRRILVVEDDPAEIENISNLLAGTNSKFKIVDTMDKALSTLSSEAFDLLYTDLHIETRAGFEEPDGLKVIAWACEQQPNLTIVANSSDPRSDIWDKALAAGAQYFVRKPVTKIDELVIAFSMARERKTLLGSKGRKKRGRDPNLARYVNEYPEGLVIDKANLQIAQGLVRRIIPTVIMGETGTGKEEFARLVHRLRVRQEGEIPFVAVNCASITESLAESLLFGHRKGSFTGADQTTTGYVAEADSGILFLDEIHTLDLKIQQKLLRVLNDGTFNRLGETRTYVSRFQLIAATTKDLDDEAEEGRFLLDLRGRISGIDIHLKPLRERKEQIPALTALFLLKHGIEFDNDMFELLCSRLQSFYWRTNIRQLYKVLESWIIRCDFEELPLHPDYIPIFKGMTAPTHKAGTLSTPVSYQNLHPLCDLVQKAIYSDTDLDVTLQTIERGIIEEALKRHKTVSECAEKLNVSRSTFDGRRRRLGIL